MCDDRSHTTGHMQRQLLIQLQRTRAHILHGNGHWIEVQWTTAGKHNCANSLNRNNHGRAIQDVETTRFPSR
jgi:UDP-N-acetylmuramate-alanine ligase